MQRIWRFDFFCALVDANLCNCTLLHVNILSVKPVSKLQRQLAHEDLLLVVLFKTKSGQLLTDAETFNKSFDFPDGKHLFMVPLQALNY